MDKKKKTNDMAMISYITHKLRMHKVYQKVDKLKLWLIATNAIWALIVSALIAMR